MPVSSFHSSLCAASATQFHIDYELVRGTEARWRTELLPLVRSESVELNLSRVERIDAAGIAALITLYCTSVESGTGFTVVDPSRHVLELLQIVGLDGILIGEDRPRNVSRACPAA